MAQKKVPFNEQGVENLPDDKPVIYKIQTKTGTNNYTGVAQRGRVKERIKEHLGEIPGLSVQIEQMNSIKAAKDKEQRIISRTKPKYNNQSK